MSDRLLCLLLWLEAVTSLSGDGAGARTPVRAGASHWELGGVCSDHILADIFCEYKVFFNSVYVIDPNSDIRLITGLSVTWFGVTQESIFIWIFIHNWCFHMLQLVKKFHKKSKGECEVWRWIGNLFGVILLTDCRHIVISFSATLVFWIICCLSPGE